MGFLLGRGVPMDHTASSCDHCDAWPTYCALLSAATLLAAINVRFAAALCASESAPSLSLCPSTSSMAVQSEGSPLGSERSRSGAWSGARLCFECSHIAPSHARIVSPSTIVDSMAI